MSESTLPCDWQGGCRYFDEFHRVSVTTKLDCSRRQVMRSSVLICLLYADMWCRNRSRHISYGFKVFPTHFSHISVLPTVHHRKRQFTSVKRLRHPTISWVVRWSQITSNLIYLPSHIRTDSVALWQSACQPLFLVGYIYLYKFVSKSSLKFIYTEKFFHICQLPNHLFDWNRRLLNIGYFLCQVSNLKLVAQIRGSSVSLLMRQLL